MAKKITLPALILCGGKGLRLRPITKDNPKPLIKINNKPILYHIISHLQKQGIKDFIIATGYKSNKIEAFMRKDFKKLSYTIINSGDVSILKRIKDSLKVIKGDFLLCYGDTITDISIQKLISHHKRHSNLVTISSYPITIPFGVMSIKNGHVRSFNEKPILDDVMNIGYYYFSEQSHKIILKHKDLVGLIKSLIKNKKLVCYHHKGIHITINTVAELEYAHKNISKIHK